jgi:hypothetical protein
MKNKPKSKVKKPYSPLDTILLVGNLLVWTSVFLALKGDLKLGAMSKLRVELITAPKTVSVKTWHAGAEVDHGYIETPKVLNLDSGTYKVKVSRPGYLEQIIAVTKEDLDTLSQTVRAELAPSNQQKFGLKIEKLENSDERQKNETETKSNIKVRVDGGLYLGPVPFEANDLVAGNHQIEFFFDSKPTPSLPCYFQITDTAKNGHTKDHFVTISRPQGNKNYVIRGCVIRR